MNCEEYLSKILLIILLLITQITKTESQTVNGSLTMLSSQKIKLEGFNGLSTYPISNTQIDEKGNFKLNYSKEDYGVVY